MRVLITGATGFVGARLLSTVVKSDRYEVVAAVRAADFIPPTGVKAVKVDGLRSDTDWAQALEGVDAVVHCAARVHVMNETAQDPLVEFRKVNVEGTLNLARQAIDAGVKRFVFVSSIKVNGEGTAPGKPYAPEDQAAPQDPYGVSKMEAEQALRELAIETGLEVVVIRPVLVYGPGVKANFLNMMRWLDKGVPLPLGAIHNRRSLVAIDNLVDLIIVCIDHVAAANETFLVSDGEDVSTTQLLTRMARALDVKSRLLPIPAGLISLAARMLGRQSISQRLCGSLQVDISKNNSLLGWTPPIGIDAALKQTAMDYQEKHRK